MHVSALGIFPFLLLKLHHCRDMRELAATISRDIYLNNPNVKWGDIFGLEAPKRIMKEAVVYPIKYPQLFTGASDQGY